MPIAKRKGCFSVVDRALRLGDAKKLFVLDHWLPLPVPLPAVLNSTPECSSKGLQVIHWYKAVLTGSCYSFKDNRCDLVGRADYLVMNISN